VLGNEVERRKGQCVLYISSLILHKRSDKSVSISQFVVVNMGNMTCCMPHSASDQNFDRNVIFSPKRGDGSSLDLPHISEREGKI
jgi:hypothetical protein